MGVSTVNSTVYVYHNNVFYFAAYCTYFYHHALYHSCLFRSSKVSIHDLSSTVLHRYVLFTVLGVTHYKSNTLQ